MNDVKNEKAEEIKFCPTCGFEGNDEMCPVCNMPMASLGAEVDRIAKVEEKKSDIFDDVSLESEQEKEEKNERNDDESDTTL